MLGKYEEDSEGNELEIDWFKPLRDYWPELADLEGNDPFPHLPISGLECEDSEGECDAKA